VAGFPKPKDKLGEKAKQPHPGLPLDKNMLLLLITRYKGNISKVADSMGCNRHTVRLRCDNDPELLKCLEDARERRIDLLEESTWEDAIADKDTAMRCFLLKTQAKHRGYEQDEAKNSARDIATAAFDFIVNKSKNPAEPKS